LSHVTQNNCNVAWLLFLTCNIYKVFSVYSHSKYHLHGSNGSLVTAGCQTANSVLIGDNHV